MATGKNWQANLERRFARQLGLALASLALIALHFLLPPNREAIRFVRERLDRFPAEWNRLQHERSPEQRLRGSYGMNYDASIFIRENLGRDDRLQLPPRAYVAPYCRPGEDGWTDPRLIYYIAGPLRTYAWHGSMRPEATHAVVIDTAGATPGLRIVDVRQEATRERVADLYRRGGSRP